MNLDKLYKKLMTRRRLLPISDVKFTEVHHIVPKCFGGDNSSENLIRLTYREHFIAHLILWKIQTDKRKSSQMAKAFFCMCAMSNESTGYRDVGRNSRWFDSAKKEANAKLQVFTKEERKMFGRDQGGSNNGMYGKTHSDETKLKIGNMSRNRSAVSVLFEDDAIQKRKKVFTEKYGGTSPFSSPETHKKSRETSLARYGVEHYNATCESKERRRIYYNSEEYKKTASRGTLCTPLGKFLMPKDASAAFGCTDAYTVRGWCMCNDKRITTLSINKYEFFGPGDIGKTYKEMGFSFEQRH